MNGIGEKYLPIGTVLLLKGGTKRCMITGFCSIDESNQDKLWDYSGCMYPEGFLSSNQTCLFDHDQIEKVCYMGLADDPEEKEFKNKIKALLNSMNQNSNVSTSQTVATPEVATVEEIPVIDDNVYSSINMNNSANDNSSSSTSFNGQ